MLPPHSTTGVPEDLRSPGQESWPGYLRFGLVQALRKERYGRLCRDEPADSTHLANLVSQGLMWSMILSLVVWLIARLGLTFWQAAGAGSLLVIVLSLFAAATNRFRLVASAIAGLWLLAGVQSFLAGGIESLAITNGLPFVLVVVVLWMWNALAFVSDIPFLLPIALVVVFLPLLTQDLWTVGDDIGAQVIAVAVVALGPLLLVLGTRFINADIEAVFRTATESMGATGDRDEAVVKAIKQAPRAEVDADAPPDDWLRDELDGLYASSDLDEVASKLAVELRIVFRRHMIWRLTRLVVGTSAFFASFIYLLAWAAIGCGRNAAESCPRSRTCV